MIRRRLGPLCPRSRRVLYRVTTRRESFESFRSSWLAHYTAKKDNSDKRDKEFRKWDFRGQKWEKMAEKLNFKFFLKNQKNQKKKILSQIFVVRPTKFQIPTLLSIIRISRIFQSIKFINRKKSVHLKPSQTRNRI